MDQTTSRKQARARVLDRQRSAAAAREARERANIADLTEFTVQLARVDEIDGWLAQKIEALRAEADRRRVDHRLAAGRALQRMRLRGETVPGIAESAGVSIKRVRGFLKSAAQTPLDGEATAVAPTPQVSGPPTPAEPVIDGRAAAAGGGIARDDVMR